MRPDRHLLSDPLEDLYGDPDDEHLIAAIGVDPRPALAPIQYAAGGGDRQRVRDLLRAGADPNAGDRDLLPQPLHFAARHNDITMIDDLLAAGADIEAHTLDAETPLMIAARYWKHAAVRRLREHGAERPPGTDLFIV